MTSPRKASFATPRAARIESFLRWLESVEGQFPEAAVDPWTIHLQAGTITGHTSLAGLREVVATLRAVK